MVILKLKSKVAMYMFMGPPKYVPDMSLQKDYSKLKNTMGNINKLRLLIKGCILHGLAVKTLHFKKTKW